MAPKKQQKMDLQSFLADKTFGDSWADEEIDLGSISVPTLNKSHLPSSNLSSYGQGRSDSFGSKPLREEFPVPDHPPFKAIINNLPWDGDEKSLEDWLVERLGSDEAIESVAIPRDSMERSRLKGFAFVTFTLRDDLVEILKYSGDELNGRKVYVNVAGPSKNQGYSQSSTPVDIDWSAVRSGPLPTISNNNVNDRYQRSSRRNFDEDKRDFDWNSARGERAELPTRDREDRQNSRGPSNRPSRPEEKEFDWSSARLERAELPQQPPRNRENRQNSRTSTSRPPAEEKEFDWGSARSEKAELPPLNVTKSRDYDNEHKEKAPFKKADDLDWNSALNNKTELSRSVSTSPSKHFTKLHNDKENDAEGQNNTDEKRAAPKELDWSTVRNNKHSFQRNFSRSNSNTRQNSNYKRKFANSPNSNSFDNLDWSQRGQVPPRQTSRKSSYVHVNPYSNSNNNSNSKNNKKDDHDDTQTAKPKKPIYSVLSTDDMDDDVNENPSVFSKPKDQLTKLEKAAAALTVSEDDASGWKTVTKSKK
ncbi:Tif3p ASCRUDRAFT_75651 [Ascoidea rubescens DSM 1968]|uniref:RRM domain-containing protein n=1 Tax=Ascoidea rubescens DSM 1968 TaxID=1344418 RepID=A0A1D2VJ59_9ASCO|nr:hypothetical protein ASCRUDRAFT_75651 [Ascoidea rubescens DSM 1968]ODV61672.1 hypothetical protein ASCRUDRAFT_75651 [Ascoidea rubescens DSM 1968]